MSIVDTNSVLIIGAGVSAPFQLPLGDKLIDEIASAIANEKELLRPDENSSPTRRTRQLLSLASTVSGFARCPIHGTVARRWLLDDGNHFSGRELKEDLAKLSDLAALLNNQTSETIDDFIVENPSYARIAKVCISVQLFLGCYRRDNTTDRYITKGFEGRSVPQGGERNWIHLLINLVRQGIRLGLVSHQNPVEIVSFNYDGVLERVLDKQFSNTESDLPDWRTFIKVTHVHGYCGDIEAVVSEPANTCLSWSNGIFVVNEDQLPEIVVQARAAARTCVRNARKVYAAGFAFAKPNVDLLGFSESYQNVRTLSYCNWDGSMGLRKSVEKMSPYRHIQTGGTTRTTIDEASGDRDNKLSVSDWFKAGIPGDMAG